MKFVNRNVGSGTRILIDYILSEECRKRNLNFNNIKSRIVGYNFEVKTHIEVAKCIAKGDADVGVGIRWVAKLFNLKFIPITWENFDFVTITSKLNLEGVKEFINILKSPEFKNIIQQFDGYDIDSRVGEVIMVS